MGQRHQTFIKIANPIKHLYASDVDKRMIEMFGTGEFTILPYHNQWLYGRTALISALNLLNHAVQFDRDTKVSTEPWGGTKSPITPNGMRGTFQKAENITDAIGFILNYIVKSTPINETGILGAWYLGKTEPEMRDDFRMGDNNDGITIIDVVENKYCFMNINEWANREAGERCNSASDLPYLFPSSAHDYVKAYYGETVATCPEYLLERAKEKGVKPETVSAQNRYENKKLVKQFAKFGVLTIDEVLEMFPKVKKEISEKSLVETK